MKYLLILALVVLALTACSPHTVPLQPIEIDTPTDIPPENEDSGVDIFSDEELGNLPPMPE